jgi:hypothetical protein
LANAGGLTGTSTPYLGSEIAAGIASHPATRRSTVILVPEGGIVMRHAFRQ